MSNHDSNLDAEIDEFARELERTIQEGRYFLETYNISEELVELGVVEVDAAA